MKKELLLPMFGLGMYWLGLAMGVLPYDLIKGLFTLTLSLLAILVVLVIFLIEQNKLMVREWK